MTEQEIEKLAVKHEDFGFGQVDKFGYTTHGFSPEGLTAFVNELKELWTKEMQASLKEMNAKTNDEGGLS